MPRDAERSLWAIPARSRSTTATATIWPPMAGPPAVLERPRASARLQLPHRRLQVLEANPHPEAAAQGHGRWRLLVWLDGDVETTRDVPVDLVEQLLGAAEICYLGRARGHSEIGFWAVRLNPRTRKFLHDIAEVYRTDLVFKLPRVAQRLRLGSVRARWSRP
jgi:hypothetical protein